MKVGTQVGIGVAIGYVLGRTRKMRWAIGLVSAGTIGRVAKNPGELVKQGSQLLGASPQVKELTQDVRGRLMEAGKVAAMAAASNQINSLTDRLQERASLQEFRPSGEDEESDSEDREEERRPSKRQRSRRDDEEEPRSTTDEDELADEEEDEEQEERQPAMRGGSSRRSRRDDEGEAEETRPPARTSRRRITDEDESGDDTSERSRRSPVRRVRR